jgi:hypothetical protein
MKEKIIDLILFISIKVEDCWNNVIKAICCKIRVLCYKGCYGK